MRIQIGTGTIYDISHYGFFLGKSPSEFVCNPKESNFVTTDFPENDGVDIYIPQVPSKKEFDYPITLIYFNNSLNTANGAITSFCNSLVGNKITIYNDHKKVKVVGYFKSQKTAEFYRQETDVITFELVFFIPKPQDCDFSI
jgi:hypothetical protein